MPDSSSGASTYTPDGVGDAAAEIARRTAAVPDGAAIEGAADAADRAGRDDPAADARARERDAALAAALDVADLQRWDLELDASEVVAYAGSQALFGRDGAERVPLPGVLAALHEDDVARVDDALRACAEGRADFAQTYRVRDASGRVRWRRSAARLVPASPEARRPRRLVGVLADVTELAEVRERLADSERRLAAQLDELERLYATTPVGLAVIDRALRYRRVNRMLAQTNGASVEAHLGRSVSEMVPDLAAPALAAMRQVLDTGEPLLGLEFVGETRARPGERRHFVEHWYPVRDASGAVVAAGVVVQDVTDRHRAEAALREADERKDEFLAMLGHELRNPLAALRNSLKAIGREPLSAQGHAALGVCARQVHQLTRLVDDLLDVSRAARGKIALRIERVAVQQTLRIVVDAFAPLLAERGQSLSVAMPAEPAWIEADGVRIAQVVENLLSNASKYSDAGGRITVGVEPDHDAVTIVVADTGIGIAAEHLPRLFEPFTQVDTAIERSRGGLGIGLALVRRLVELHGGSVVGHSDGPGRGSTFTVRLPRCAAPGAAGTVPAAH